MRVVYEWILIHSTFSSRDFRPLHHSDIREGHLISYVFTHCLCVGTNLYGYVEGTDSSASTESTEINWFLQCNKYSITVIYAFICIAM